MKNVQSNGICLPREIFQLMSPAFLEMAACPWEAMNEFPALL